MLRGKGHAPQRGGVALVMLFLFAACASSDFVATAQVRGGNQGNTIRIYKKVAPAIVFIKCSLASDYLINGASNSIGSGIILDEQGFILTNAHVVERATKILVVLHDGAQLNAVLVGSDPYTDLALIQVDFQIHRQPAVLLGNSDRIEIGQEVVAIGHPFGLGYALTTGVISGFGATPDPQAVPQERVIQTSAAINPGNSGGPLVDKEGQVIGINAAIMAGGQNIGFAIPVNTAKTIVNELREHGRVIRPWLGVTGKLLSDEVIDLFAIPLAKGLLVAHVDDGSPAEKAGLRAGALNVVIEGEPWILGGDIILAINGKGITTWEQYAAMLRTLEVGQTVTLRVLRYGVLHTIETTVEEKPQSPFISHQTRVQERMGFQPMSQRNHSSVQGTIDVGF